MSNSYFSRSLALTGLALIIAAAACQESTDSLAGPVDVRTHHRPDHAGGPGGGGDEDPSEGSGSVVDLSGAYSTAASQPVESKLTGRAAEARSADGAPITYAVDGLTTAFDASSCDWSSNLDAAGASALWTEASGKFASSDARSYLTIVNLKANGQAAGEHRTEGRFLEAGFMWELKAGTPGDLLGSPNATGTFTDQGATHELTISDGALRFRKVLCGDGAGCTTVEEWAVACPNADTFISTVTP